MGRGLLYQARSGSAFGSRGEAWLAEGHLGSNPGAGTDSLCYLGQVEYSESPSIKWGWYCITCRNPADPRFWDLGVCLLENFHFYHLELKRKRRYSASRFLSPSGVPDSGWGIPSKLQGTLPKCPVHRSADSSLAAVNGTHWPSCQAQQYPLPVLHSSNPQPWPLKLQWMPGGKNRMKCKQMGHHHTAYWASDPLMPGWFEVEGLERREA